MTRPLPDIEAELAAERRRIAERWITAANSLGLGCSGPKSPAIHSPGCHARLCECGCCSCGTSAPRLEPPPAPTSQRWLGRVLERLERVTDRRPGWVAIALVAASWVFLAGLVALAAWALGVLP